MIDWKQLTPDARNQLVAERLFGWKPELCSVQAKDETDKAIVWSEVGLQWQCSMCGACAEDARKMEHGPTNPYPRYSEDLDISFLVLNHWPVCEWNLERTSLYGAYACTVFTDSGFANDGMTVIATTPQEAICIAVLRANGAEVVYGREEK